MKRTITLLLAIVLVLCLVACGDNEKSIDTPNNNDTSITEVDKSINIGTEGKDDESKVNLSLTYKIPMKDIYVDAPGFQEIEQAYTELFIVHEEKYVAITAARKSAATDVEDAHTKAFEEFIVNMTNYEGGVNSINIIHSETKIVNGMDVYYFEGTINYGKDNVYDGYAAGYSFIMDGIPCEIIGSVISDGQENATKDEISKIVDAMIASVRAEQ